MVETISNGGQKKSEEKDKVGVCQGTTILHLQHLFRRLPAYFLTEGSLFRLLVSAVREGKKGRRTKLQNTEIYSCRTFKTIKRFSLGIIRLSEYRHKNVRRAQGNKLRVVKKRQQQQRNKTKERLTLSKMKFIYRYLDISIE